MSQINKDTVLHNVKEAYIGLTGDTDTITYGNLPEKIAAIQTGGGGYGDFTVRSTLAAENYPDTSDTELVVHE